MPVEIGVTPASGTANVRTTRYMTWVVSGLFAIVLLVGIAAVFLALKWPFTRQALVDVLQERSVRSVTIGSFRTTYFPPGCIAERISFLHRKHKERPPLITIEKLTVEGSYWGLISFHKHLPKVRLFGMHVTVPPSNPDGRPNPIMPLTHGTPGPPLVINSVIADGTVLDFVQRTPGQPPFRLTVHKLLLDNVGNNLPPNYRAVIYNSNPPGRIESAGRFGIWNSDNPASSPVRGWYRLTNANLGVYRVLTGTLQSTGTFDGALGAIAVKGSADIPDFHIKESSHTRELRAEFDATVAATDGNVDLNVVTARFDHTTLTVNGFIRGESKEPGKAVSLNVHSGVARIDDLVNLVAEDGQSPIIGNLGLDTQIALPQGAKSFLRDMEVNGTFRVASGLLTNREIQQDLTRVSNSAAKKDGLSQQSADTLRCDLNGAMTVRKGVAELSRLRLNIPGAGASLNGSYSLLDYSIDMRGTLQTDGSPAAATTGFKSVMLKGLTPFLKTQDGRKIMPFKIRGHYRDAKIELDLGHKSKPAIQ